MIYLIHGQNQVDSRRFLIRLKAGYQDIQPIPGKGLTSRNLKESLDRLSHPLFGGKAVVLIENFEGNWQIFPKNLPQGFDLILWSDDKIEAGDLPVKNLLFNQIRKATSFKLADAVLFRNEKEALVLACQLLNAKEPIEKIIGALTRGFFLVYAAKEGSLQDANLASFAKRKIEEQAKGWSRGSLKKALLHLLSLDVGLKEGARSHLALIPFISQAVSL